MKDLSGKKVLVFGDSIMYGSGNGGFGVGEYLEKDLKMVCKKYAVGGARVGYKAGKSWVPEQVAKAIEEGAEADYIIFDGFTNDCNISEGATEPDVPLGEILSGYGFPEAGELKKEGSTFAECFQSVIYTLLLHFPKAKYCLSARTIWAGATINCKNLRRNGTVALPEMGSAVCGFILLQRFEYLHSASPRPVHLRQLRLGQGRLHPPQRGGLRTQIYAAHRGRDLPPLTALPRTYGATN